jgi:hypothetical protein
VAGECALKSVVLKTKGTRCSVGSLGKRKVAGWHFASSSSECVGGGGASDGGMKR